jgi:glycosidase
MIYLLKGVPFIYQGQEIGMPAAHYDNIDCFDDVECLGAYREMITEKGLSEAEALEKVNFGSRDNARHPMAWDGSAKCGFTTGEPWLIAHSRAAEVNVASDLAAERSVYRFYQQLLKLRGENDAFTDGTFELISKPEDDHFIYTRTQDGEKWAVICNFEKDQQIKLPFDCEEPALANLGRKTADGAYAPYECAAAKIISIRQ